MDIEEMVGAGCWDSIKRVGGGFACLWLGAATGFLAMIGASMIQLAVDGSLGVIPVSYLLNELLWGLLAGPLLLFGSGWLILLAPLVLIVFFYYVRGEGGQRLWVGLAAVVGLLVVLGYTDWDDGLLWSGLAFALWLGSAGSLGLLAFLLAAWQRRRAEQHLLSVAVENEARRRALLEAARDHGGTEPDREP